MKKKPKSQFTRALEITLTEQGWCLPESRAIEIYDEHVRRLELEIETLTGGRSVGPQRIDPMERRIPS